MTGGEEGWIAIDGSRMRYLRGGSGPPLVLLHGLLGYSFSWRLVMPALCRHATVYAVDSLGFGFSDRPRGIDSSMRSCAARLLNFADAMGLDCFDLLGTSHGGAVAMMTAAASPHRICRLILSDPVNPWSKHGRRLAPFLSAPPFSLLFLGLAPRLRIAHEVVLRRLYGDTRRIPPGTLEGYSKAFSVPGTLQHALAVLHTWIADLQELEASLPRIAHIPTLLIWGSEDRAVDPASALRLRQCFRDCRLIMLEGAGHLPYEECPEAFSQAVSEFLGRTKVRG